jgi:hypothetical protein
VSVLTNYTKLGKNPKGTRHYIDQACEWAALNLTRYVIEDAIAFRLAIVWQSLPPRPKLRGDTRCDVIECDFVGSQLVGIAGSLCGMDGGLKGYAQRIGWHEQASGEFVGLPFHPAVFDFPNGIVWRSEFMRGVQGRLALLISSTSFSPA